MKTRDGRFADALAESISASSISHIAISLSALIRVPYARRQAMHALSVLSDRELADMSIKRKDIAQLVHNGRPIGWSEFKPGDDRSRET